jgi:hypothetical protein
MGRLKSTVQQVLETMNAIKQIGGSKHSAKESFRTDYGGSKAIDDFMHSFGKTSGIFSDQTFKDYLSKAINFAKFVKTEFGVKDISQITAEHVKAYFTNESKRGNQSAIEKFETALIAKYGKHFDLRVAEAVAGKPRTFKERAGSYGYSDKNALLNYINNSNIKDTHKLIVNIAAETGVRIHKAITQAGIITRQDGTVYTQAKGGRIQELNLNKETKAELMRLSENGIFILNGKEYKTALSELEKAAIATGQAPEAFHGFKQNLAREIRDDLQRQGLSFKESTHDKGYIQALEHNREVGAYRRG